MQAVAQRAGIRSTRTISYHFAGKDDLIAAVSGEIFRIIGEFVAGHETHGVTQQREQAVPIRFTVVSWPWTPTLGSAWRFLSHAGSSSAPPFEATTTKSSPAVP